MSHPQNQDPGLPVPVLEFTPRDAEFLNDFTAALRRQQYDYYDDPLTLRAAIDRTIDSGVEQSLITAYRNPGTELIAVGEGMGGTRDSQRMGNLIEVFAKNPLLTQQDLRMVLDLVEDLPMMHSSQYPEEQIVLNHLNRSDGIVQYAVDGERAGDDRSALILATMAVRTGLTLATPSTVYTDQLFLEIGKHTTQP